MLATKSWQLLPALLPALQAVKYFHGNVVWLCLQPLIKIPDLWPVRQRQQVFPAGSHGKMVFTLLCVHYM
jgi:hypothetical protein